MNQIFNMGRFAMLVRGHWAENRKRYGLSMLAMGGLLLAWEGFLMTMNETQPLGTGIQFVTYFVGLYFTGCLFASTAFTQFSSKPQGIHYLLVPASHLEKLVCAIFFAVVIYFIAFTFLFYLVDIPMVRVANRMIAGHPRVWPNTSDTVPPVHVYNIFTGRGAPIPEQDFHLFLSGYFAAQSAFILGSVYFSRYGFIKTTVAILLFLLVTVVFITKGIESHLPDGWRINNFLQWSRNNTAKGYLELVRLPKGVESLLTIGMLCGGPPLFWVITYFRLKEKEV